MAEIKAWSTYDIHYFIGKVVGSNKSMETRVTGGGGGGQFGHSAPVNISSTTYTHDDIYLQSKTGQEHALRLVNWNVACRADHELMAIWLIKKGKERGPYAAIYNRNLDEIHWGETALQEIHLPSTGWWIFAWLSVFIWVGFFLVPALIVLRIAGVRQMKKNKKIITSFIHDTIKQRNEAAAQ